MSVTVEAESFQCVTCKHLYETELKCEAFPGGIPEEVLYGFVRHNQILPDQLGEIIYEKSKINA